jgi:hypothetical protein
VLAQSLDGWFGFEREVWPGILVRGIISIQDQRSGVIVATFAGMR